MLATALPPPHHRARRLALALLLAGLAPLLLGLPGAMPQPAWATGNGAARRCPPAGTTIIADVPWPQQRYDLSALSQITDGAGVTVAVVDSGVDATHPQLAGAVVEGVDRLDPAGDGRRDCVGHGTAVASVIAARPARDVAMRGLAPAAAILPIRVSERIQTEEGPTGAGDLGDLAAGIRAATRRTPKPAVINVSLSTVGDHPALRSAVAEAIAADVVVVASVGSADQRGGVGSADQRGGVGSADQRGGVGSADQRGGVGSADQRGGAGSTGTGGDPVPYPAAYDGVVGVGAIGADGTRTGTSRVGSYVDLVAPGDAIVAAAPRRGHQLVGGTSFATPFVAATAALIRARWPELTASEVVRRLLATADPAPGARPSPAYGWGVLNPMRALTEVMGTARVGATPTPLAGGRAMPASRPGPAGGAVRVAAALAVAAAVVAAVAVCVPYGRRRRWRPGDP